MNSKLQIISGQFKGRKLYLPSTARPTQNRARIALFNVLGAGIISPNTNLHIWDAFAGSGAFGLECLSRYPGCKVTFTDVALESINTINNNIALLGVGYDATVIKADAMTRISQIGPNANVIFLDPPYAEYKTGSAFVRKLGLVAKPGTILIWEQETINACVPDETIWGILRDKTYGRARFLFLIRKQNKKP